MVTEFTIKSFQSLQTSLNSIQYLLVFWAKMITTVGQSKPYEDENLKDITSQVIYIYTIN